MGVDIFSDGNTSMTHVPGDDSHLYPRFPGCGGVLVAQTVRGLLASNALAHITDGLRS